MSGLVCGALPVHPSVCEEVDMSFRSKPNVSNEAETASKGRILSERARKLQRAARSAIKSDMPSNDDRVVETSSSIDAAALDAWPLPGLAPLTRVRTSFGDVHAAALRKGDEVLTRSGAYEPILWLTRIRLDEQILSEKPDSNPVVIAAGALGSSVPSQEIIVSPRQVICADAKTGLPGNREAATLVSRPGVRRIRETCLSYTMFHIGRPAEIFCEGTYLVFPMDA